MLVFLFALFFSIFIINFACAENVTSPDNLTDDFNQIQVLIDDANPGDSIDLGNKTYMGNGSSIKINKNITIQGNNAVLNANKKSNIFVISSSVNVNLINLTLTNGNASEDGGAIYNSGILTIFNSTISNNLAYGGAIHTTTGSKLTVHNSLFDHNRAAVGAAIDNYDCDLNVFNSTFTYNVANEGGAIYNRFGLFVVNNSIFINNSAERGGGVYNNRGKMVIYSSEFYHNYAGHLGGGIKSWGECAVYDSIVINNTGYQGGGLFISQYRMRVYNCIVENNNAFDGGGFFVDVGGDLRIRDTVINNNSAENCGGGISLNRGILTLTNISITNNYALQLGGGIHYDDCGKYTSQLKDIVLNNNSARYGGGIYINSANVNVINSEFSNNSAVSGGAIYNKNNLELQNSLLKNNSASLNGGGIYNLGELALTDFKAHLNGADCGGVIYNVANAKVDNGLFDSNIASQAAAVYSTHDLLINNSKFYNNQVTRSYGVIYILDGEANISSCSFNSNRGSDEGGCIFNSFAKVYINNTQFISNKAISYGGAIENGGEMTIENSLFDKNQAYGAGAIDNAGELIIIKSNFTTNKASKNGGAIDNNGNLTALGCIFEGNVAGGSGGAVIARRNTTISHSIVFNNRDSNGFEVYNQTWDDLNLTENWWGTNNPDFAKILNFNLDDDFVWIQMKFINSTPLIQYKTVNLEISFDEVINRNNVTFKLNDPELLPNFHLDLSLDNYKSLISNGILEYSAAIPKIDSITAFVNNQQLSLNIVENQYNIINNKNLIEDYSGKTTFKVRIVDDFGSVGGNVDVVMKLNGKTYILKTDKEGYASKTFSLAPGKYTIYTVCDGKSVKNTLTIRKVLNAKSITKKKAKKIKYSATLKTSNGKAIVGKKITFKIKGKTYAAKTNKKGIAKVTFKNLKVGRYSIVVKYLDSKVKATLKVKK